MTLRRRHGRLLAAGTALLLAGALALLPATPLQAQTGTTSLQGTVRSSDEPIPGALVEAVAVASGFRREARTNDSGRYSLSGLQPGVYELTVTSEGFTPDTRRVQVLVAQDVTADVDLQTQETFSEEMTVVGDSVELLVETENSVIATNVTPEQIETLPQNSRNFLNFASLAPGVNFTENDDQAGQKFRSGGADSRQVNVFVDGLSYKNDLLQGGAFMQDSSRGNPFPQNAVQEFRVLTQNYKAEYEKAAAAVITAVTKSGGNEWTGDVFYLFQDKDFVTQDDFSEERGEDKPEYSRDQYGISIGGPISRDEANFFVSYEGNRQDRATSIFRGGNFDLAPPSVRDRLDDYETGVFTTPLESDLFFGKVSWQLSPGQDVFATYHVRDEQEVRGFGGQRVREGAESFEISTEAAVLRHNWVGGELFNEVTASYQQLRWNPTALASTLPRENFIGILDVGGKDATQDFIQDKIGIRDDLTYLAEWRGRHTFKTGVGVNWLDYEVTKEQFENGLFEYREDEQWRFPFQARVGFGDPTLAFDNTQIGVYLQDDWQILDNLTLNLGVRWDFEDNMINNDYVTPPELVDALNGSCRTYDQAVGGQTEWCLNEFLDLDEFTTDGNDRDPYYGMVQPRIGFAWDVENDGRTVVFGGWGRYYDRVILNDIFAEEHRQQFRIFSFCFSEDGGPAPNCGVPALQWDPSFLSANALRDLVASGQAPGPEIFLTSNDMRPPRSTQWTVGVRRQLGNWLGELAYGGVRTHNNLMYFFGDLPPGTTFENRFGGNVPVDGYARVFVTSTARRSWYDALYLKLDRPITAGGRWGANIAYTYAEAEQTGTDNPGEGVAFGAFDYASPADLYKFPGTNDERHRFVGSGTVRLPYSFLVSTFITLGSGTPYTIFDNSMDPFRVRWNEGRPPRQSFLGIDEFAYRSVDLRVEWTAPPIGDATLTLIGEGFNIFDYDNYGSFVNSVPRLPAVNEDFGEPTSEFNTRRFQVGARVSF